MDNNGHGTTDCVEAELATADDDGYVTIPPEVIDGLRELLEALGPVDLGDLVGASSRAVIAEIVRVSDAGARA